LHEIHSKANKGKALVENRKTYQSSFVEAASSSSAANKQKNTRKNTFRKLSLWL